MTDSARPTTSTQKSERATPAIASTLSSDIDTSAMTICTIASDIDLGTSLFDASIDSLPPRSSRQSFQQIHRSSSPPASRSPITASN